MLFQLKRYRTASLLILATAVWFAAMPAVAVDEPAKKPADEPADEPADPYAVPEGTPAELAEFIEGLLKTPPKTREARMKAMAAMQKASDKILAGDAEEKALAMVVRVKMMFARSPKDLQPLIEKLEKAKQPKLLRQVRGRLLQVKLRPAAQGSREELVKLIEEIEEFLSEGPLERNDVSLAMQAAQTAERSGRTELAADAYKTFAKLFAKSEDESIAGMAKRLEGVVRRLTVVGKEMEVEGTLVTGEEFDWSKYRGKVVLVDFWATWCGPCVGEVPNMIENYRLYHDKGFEIVGISLDRSRDALEKFIEDREIPWTILYSDDGPSPTVDYYGVLGIPTMMLVDTEGKVVSIRARGPQLHTELEKLLGPVEEAETEEEEEDEAEDAGEEEE
jgi:thiol-disulfide isomerase/thioredoxin